MQEGRLFPKAQRLSLPETQTFREAWRDAFERPAPYTHRDKRRGDFARYDWHAFSFNRGPMCHDVVEALSSSGDGSSTRVVVFEEDPTQVACETSLRSVIVAAKKGLPGTDVYFAPRDLAWTLVLTHELDWGLGPYFARPDWRALPTPAKVGDWAGFLATWCEPQAVLSRDETKALRTRFRDAFFSPVLLAAAGETDDHAALLAHGKPLGFHARSPLEKWNEAADAEEARAYVLHPNPRVPASIVRIRALHDAVVRDGDWRLGLTYVREDFREAFATCDHGDASFSRFALKPVARRKS